MTMNIVITDDGSLPVMCHLHDQAEPQPAFLQFCPGKQGDITLTAIYRKEDDGIDLTNRHILHFSIAPNTTRESLQALADNPRLERSLEMIRAAYTGKGEGDEQPAHFDGLVDDIEVKIKYLLDAVLDTVEVWDASNYLDSYGIIDSLLCHGGVKQYARYLLDTADCPIVGDMEAAICEAVKFQIEEHITDEPEPSESIKAAAKLLAEHNAYDFSDLLTRYEEKFEGESAA